MIESYYRPKYFNNEIIKGFIHFHYRSSIKELIQNFQNNRYRKLNSKFKLFWSNYKKVTRPVYNIETLIHFEFDAIICGSDQIWEPEITGGLDRFLGYD